MNRYINEEPIAQELPSDTEKTIEYYLEAGQKHEEAGEKEDALKSYEKALGMLESKRDEKAYKLYIKLGDMLQARSVIDESLEYYEYAYNIAQFLQNKIFQINSVSKIIQNYVIMGKIEESISLAEIADKLLQDTDYIEGKIEIYICWIKIYVSQNEYYKAREIGNKAIKLCGDKYLFHKGRVLNFLASMYNEFIDSNEHLDMLESALKCFKEVNYQMGILGMINNIAGVYADRLQDNDKALEYYIKLKDGSQNSDYKELEVFAYVNIGEIYFKKLMFDDALFWLKDSLKKAKEASVRNMILHSYSYLIYTSLHIYDYKSAYYYYKQATEELSIYPDQGTTLALFHRAISRLFLDFGQVEKARTHIKEALNIEGNVESVVRWDMGLVYELIRLKGARNRTEILDLLQGVRFILVKYRNIESRLNIVYDFTIELMDSGYSELAFELLDENEDLKADQKILNTKYAYIKAKRYIGSKANELKNLRYALKLAKDSGNIKLYWKLLSSIGDFYLRDGNIKKAVRYYYDACSAIKEVLLNVPSEFRVETVKIHHLYEPFEKLINIKSNYPALDDMILLNFAINEDKMIEFYE